MQDECLTKRKFRGRVALFLLAAGVMKPALAQEPAAQPADAGTPATTAPPAPAPEAAPAPGTAAAAPAPAAAKPAETRHEEKPSPLVPDVDTRQQKKKGIDPELTYRAGKGLVIESEDGDFELAVKIRGQVLATFEKEHSGEEATLLGAQVRRARVAFQGHMFGKHNKYKMELAVSPRDSAMQNGVVGTAPLLDWYMTFDYLEPATLVVGQYKVPFSRQRVVSSGALQMVDRSIVQGEFNLDRNVGFDVRSTSLLDHHLHYYAGVYAGEGRNASELHDMNIVYLARLEALPFGKFQDYVEGDFERTGPRASVGASYAYVANSSRNQGPLGRAPADGGTTSYHTAEGDVLFKAYGLSLTGEVFWRDGKRKQGDLVDATGAPIPTELPRDGYGWFAQAGYLLPHSMFEVEGRYGMLRRSSATSSSLADRNELGGGVSYYFARHSFKLQADYFRLWGDDGMSLGTDQARAQLEAGF
jgi:hypothetical protein